MSRSLRTVLALVAVQATLVGIYWLVEQRRGTLSEPALTTAPPQHMDGRLPPLLLRTRGGDRLDLRGLARPTLLHFWATWCTPCRVELPGILALPETHAVHVVAVSLDQDWADVERFLDGRELSNVYLADAAEVETALNVRTLPVTYLVEPGGQLRFRFDGTRDWTDSRFLRTWMKGDAGSSR